MEELKKKKTELDDKTSGLLRRAEELSRRINELCESAENAVKEYGRLIGEGERKLANEELDKVKPLRGEAAGLVGELRKLRGLFPELREFSKSLWEDAAAYAVEEEEIFKKADYHIEKVRTFRVYMSDCAHSVDRREKELDKIIARFD